MIMNSLGVLSLLLISLLNTEAQEVGTAHGTVRGRRIDVLGKAVDVFTGIPFAKPPVGDLRFKHPQPAEPWGVLDATVEKPSCMQSITGFQNLNVGEEFMPPDDFSEDCLHLNIWKPSWANMNSNHAVMVWIYGGGFAIGSISAPLHNGRFLAAENNVIVVSVNYRVGPLGFGYFGRDTVPGNMGLLDQLEGIKWVKENIGSFGGDSNSITLFGESAGSISVGYHLLSPMSQEYFNSAILESGSPLTRLGSGLETTKDQGRERMIMIAKSLNCPDDSELTMFQCLQSVDARRIVAEASKMVLERLTFGPVREGYFLPFDYQDVIRNGKQKKTNILIGTTKDEMALFFYSFINVQTRTSLMTGKPFGPENFSMGIGFTSGIVDPNRVKAISSFYESEQSPPRDYLQILNDIGSDAFFKCPSVLISDVYAETNDVYFYSLEYRLSNLAHPEWMGVPHTYEIHLVFGMPLDDNLGYNEEDKALSRTVMTYWTNFAKTGNPNTPVAVRETWQAYSKEMGTYLSLNTTLTNKQGYRRHQCAFVNEILPLIPAVGAEQGDPTDPNMQYPSGSDAPSTSVVFMLSLLAAWKLL